MNVLERKWPGSSSLPTEGDPGDPGAARDYLFGALAVLAATALAVPLEYLVHNTTLVFVYVLAVIITGLRYGTQSAILASILAFLSFNFFLTEPRHTFHVARQDELATLVFLFLIAMVCGPAAARIRRQLILLREANRYSEAMCLLGQELSVAEDTKAVWRSVSGQLNRALQTDCFILTTDQANADQFCPAPIPDLNTADRKAIDWARKYNAPAGRLTDTLNESNWTVFPISKNARNIAVALFRFSLGSNALLPFDRRLIITMLHQAADTWRRIQLVSELESAHVKAEVEQLRSALLSSVSHDLKSPLSAMMGAAESLRVLDKQLAPQDRMDLADTILQESQRLESHIQNLLDMTRLGQGDISIERDWISLSDIIGSAIMRLKRYFPGVKTEFRSESPGPLLYAHAALLEQALFNVLENAAKFGPSEETIQIEVSRHDDYCEIAIEDQGPGIPAELREHVFDMFYVASEGDQRKQSTGLGLAICRGMIGAHGGTVRATESTNGRGTRFVINLPIDHPGLSMNDGSSDEDGE